MACPCENNTSSTPNIPCTGQSTCVEIVSSDCISYVGAEKKCGTDVVYENGDSLSTVQSKIVDYICEKVTPAPTCFTHYVGEVYGGGVVFHVYKDALGEEHGLIVSIINQSPSSMYSDVLLSIGASTTWDGQTNTNLMSTQPGVSVGAWEDVNNYSYGGYTDWYLPAIDELSLLWQNRFNINKSLTTIIGATQIENLNYWSSTEDNTNSATHAYAFTFSNGYAFDNNKTSTYTVRAIRQF
jgi:hypothetical protein